MSEYERLKAELKELEKTKKAIVIKTSQKHKIAELKKQIYAEKMKQSKMGKVLSYLGKKAIKITQPPTPEQIKRMSSAKHQINQLLGFGSQSPPKKKRKGNIDFFNY